MINQTDLDAQETAIGVGGQQSPVSALHNTHSGWVVDGLGIRGPQKDSPQEKATPTPMNFGLDSGSRSQSSSPSSAICNPGAIPPSGDWVFAVSNGDCFWMPIVDCT